MNKAVFLDRDGVINVDKEYVHKIEDFDFIPRAIDALKILSKTNFKIIIVTDQSGIGRGYYTVKDYNAVTEYMLSEFNKNNIRIDEIYYCPHHPEENCECRKPNKKLILNAEKSFNLDLEKSYIIGDKTKDIMLGKNAGCKTIAVKTGKGGNDGEFDVKPDFIADDLSDAVNIILSKEKY